jgi:hypothetical protein
MMLSGTIYHFVFLKAAREGWPVVSQIVRLVVRDEFAQRDRFMRENLDAMAQKVGEMQAKLVKLEAMSDRVSGLAGLKPDELLPLRQVEGGGKGGPFVPAGRPSLEQLQRTVAGLDEATDWHTDLFIFSESRLFQARFEALRLPSAPPVEGRSARASAFAATPSPAAPPCTPGWTSRPTRARPSSPRPAAWCWAPNGTPSTATRSRWTMATAW